MKAPRWAAAALLLANVSCLKIVTLRTVIHENGAADRNVCIESRDAPDVESDLRLPAKEGWQHYEKTPKRFEARGHFDSVADIPLDFEKTVTGPDDKPFEETSKSVKDYRSFRCALFTVHTYTETITDVTSREAFDAAVEEFIKLRTFGYAAAETVLGDEFHLDAATAYVDKEVVPRVRRLAALYWQAARDKRCDLNERLSRKDAPLRRQVEKILGELGMTIATLDDGTIDGNKTFPPWFYGKLSELVPRKNGEKLTPEQWTARLAADGKAWEAAWKAVVEQRFGTTDAFERHAWRHGLRLVGAYFQFLAHGFDFRVSVVMPGQIVETNGLISGDEASWTFSHDEVFPRYRMRVRSVSFAPANDRGDGRSVIASSKNAALLADFIAKQKDADRDRILAALTGLAKTGNPAALRALAAGEHKIDRLDRLLETIGLAD
jgi:hypothetical protein